MATTVSASTSIPAATGAGNRRAIAVAGAALAPSAVWLLAQATGIELTVTQTGQPPTVIGLPLIVATALVASLAGWAALAILQRMTGHARALWTSLATGALLASFGPIAIVAATTETGILLALMHVTVAIVLIPGLRATIPAHRSADGRQDQS